jgi:tRNA 2-selenouridine synthase
MRRHREDYAELFLQNIPLMDVRAPVEFNQGAFPLAENIYLLDDAQRERIGIRYKQQGQNGALALGYQLATPEVRKARVSAWQAFTDRHPEGCLYCFRGGLRSRITHQWLAAVGIDYPYVSGGYKAMRRFLIGQLEAAATVPMQIVGGMTGTGKTALIKSLDNGLDLEGLANHRGSSFGRRVRPQPTQINFENRLAIACLKKRHRGVPWWALEDEGKRVGACAVPLPLVDAMQRAPLVVIEESVEARLQRLQQEYVVDTSREYRQVFGETEGWLRFRGILLKGIDGIRKRLGGRHYRQVRENLEQACEHGDLHQVASRLQDCIAFLLEHYYDPMYQYQLGQKAGRIAYRDDWNGVQAYLQHLTP